MKTNQAWGWLVAGVIALGLNGFYQDGGAVWMHRAVNAVMAGIGERTSGVVALATGRADWFLAKSEMVAARQQTASCRLATSVARMQTRIGADTARNGSVRGDVGAGRGTVGPTGGQSSPN